MIGASQNREGGRDVELTAALKALADDNRLLILRLLGRRDYCVRALARQLGVSQAAVSQHLKVLREAGLVSSEKRGYFTHYRVVAADLMAVSSALAALAQASPLQRSVVSTPARRSISRWWRMACPTPLLATSFSPPL